MKALFGLLLALVLSVSGADALAQIADLNSAINKAGRQRMLSQRMAKAYFQIGQQVEVDRSKKILDASVAQFGRGVDHAAVACDFAGMHTVVQHADAQ